MTRDSARRGGRRPQTGGLLALGLLALLPACGAGPPEEAASPAALTTEEVTPEQRASVLYQAYQAVRSQDLRVDLALGGKSDTLSEYAARCDLATGIHVPTFNCDAGTEVPGQDLLPDPSDGFKLKCAKPNVLNGQCDPGSKFQVVARSDQAIAVAHCRKVGLPKAGSVYNDIAVIQHNKVNGAVCFYQALTNLPGSNVVEPSQGQSAWRWMSPAATERIGCTSCHDNGAFIRSPYVAQLRTPPHALPSAADGYDNQSTPLRYVGLDFVTNRSWSVTTARAPGDTGAACTTCHRLGINNHRRLDGGIYGTAARLANIATARTQASKLPHSSTSPIWMRPGQITYYDKAEASASAFQSCANGFWSGQPDGFTSGTPTPGCGFTPLGTSWTGLSPAQAVSVLSPPLLF